MGKTCENGKEAARFAGMTRQMQKSMDELIDRQRTTAMLDLLLDVRPGALALVWTLRRWDSFFGHAQRIHEVVTTTGSLTNSLLRVVRPNPDPNAAT
jgi:hypothetical protein